jgi:DNA-binding PadR family transcriptional regulator
MRGKTEALVPLEKLILLTAAELVGRRPEGFYGLELVEELGDPGLAWVVTIRPALRRLERLGLVVSHWEKQVGDDLRPRRRYYTLVDLGGSEG